MSNRPVRLKYLKPKMKIILCIFLLYITAVSVFGQSVELNDILGQSVKFPAAVKKVGNLIYSGVIIGDVTEGSFTALPNEKFSGRVQWDSSTGLFSLSGLKMEDIGEYKVQNKDQIIAVFQLNVYKDNVNVSKPHVSVTGDEYPCTLLCAVERGTEATLSWYREGEKKSLVSSRVKSASHLHLSVPVERSGTYTCEAKNSVSNETSDPLTVGAHCTVSVFVELNGILGQSVKFPAAVKKGGYLMYGKVNIGDSSLGTPGIGKYSGRVQWDSCTGLFSLSGLTKEDSGEYKVHNKDQNITVFQLNVYKDNVNVSKPHVSITQNEYPCTLQCTAERGTEATLSWYREGEKKPYSRSSVRSAPHLDLPQTVERSGTYTCEAKNSVSNEKASITVGDHCTDSPTSSNTVTVFASVIAAVAVFTAVVFAVLYCRIREEFRGFIRRPLGIIRELRANRRKHSTKDDGRTLIQDGRTLIQVKELLDTVDLHASVKELLDTVDLHASGETRVELSSDAVGSLIEAARSLIQVKELLDDVDPSKYAQSQRAYRSV